MNQEPGFLFPAKTIQLKYSQLLSLAVPVGFADKGKRVQ